MFSSARASDPAGVKAAGAEIEESGSSWRREEGGHLELADVIEVAVDCHGAQSVKVGGALRAAGASSLEKH